MNEQTEKLIRELAEKLGTTIDKLWMCLVKQAPITATCELVTLALFGFLALVILIAAWYNHKHKMDESGVFALTLLGGVAAIATMIAVLALSPEIAAGFFNPEYWALKQIMPR